MLQRASLAVALLLLTACGDGILASVTSLRAAHARWERSGIDSYELTVRRLCFCPSEELVRLKVVDGAVVSRTVVSTGQPVSALYANEYPDVPGLFAIVEQAMREADDLHTEFDANYGYPVVISIDWAEDAIDDEMAYRTETFTIIP